MSHINSIMASEEAHIDLFNNGTELPHSLLDVITFELYNSQIEILATFIQLRNYVFL